MSRVLIDSHAFLWFLYDDPRLSDRAGLAVENPETEKLISVGTLWEIAIKSRLGKLELGYPLASFFQRFVSESELEIIDIEIPHLVAYGELPFLHRDPFDRLLVAQAQVLQVPIVTADPKIAAYEIAVVW